MTSRLPLKSAPKRRKPRSGVSESTLVTSILRTLALKGIFAWRQNNGAQRATYKGKERLIKMAEPGTPDILLVLPRDVLVPVTGVERFDASKLGQLCGIEVKSATGKLRKSQVAWHARAKYHGVRVGVARSISEALALVELWRGQP